MWNAIGVVTGAFSLIAFIVAAAYWAYRRSLLNTEKLVHSVPDAERARVIDNFIQSVHVDTSDLPPSERYRLAMEIIASRAKASRQNALVVSFFGLVVGVVAIFALARNGSGLAIADDGPFAQLTGQWQATTEDGVVARLSLYQASQTHLQGSLAFEIPSVAPTGEQCRIDARARVTAVDDSLWLHISDARASGPTQGISCVTSMSSSVSARLRRISNDVIEIESAEDEQPQRLLRVQM